MDERLVNELRENNFPPFKRDITCERHIFDELRRKENGNHTKKQRIENTIEHTFF